MRQLVEDRTAVELAAAEALLTLAGIRYEQSPQYQPLKTATSIVTSTPYPRPPKKRVYIAPAEDEQTDCLSVIYSRRDIRKCNSLSPVSSGSDEKAVASTPKPKTELTPSIPVKSHSGRIIKRTRRFISQSDEERDPQIGARKLTTPGKRAKKQKVNNEENQTDIIQPAKRIKLEKIEPVCVADEPKVNDENISSGSGSGSNSKSQSESCSRFIRDLFNSSIKNSIQLDKVRHSRLFEAAYEKQNRTTAEATVEFQYRAAENLITYKAEIDAKRNQIAFNRSSKVMAVMQKFRGLKNRQQICSEFATKFSPTESAKWKPFTEDANRSNDISNYKELQMTKQPFLKFWIDQLLSQKHGKEKARSILIEIIKMMPNRPEVRHEFINGNLPKLVAAHKQATKKNKGLPVKSEPIEASAGLPFAF